MNDLNILEALAVTANKSKEYANNNYTNALIGTARGEIISLDDVSPLQHTVTVDVKGKNYCSVASDTVSGTNSYTSKKIADVPLPNGTYTISCDFTQTGTDKSLVNLSLRKYKTTVYLKENNGTGTSGKIKGTFTVTDDCGGGITIYGYSNESATSLNTSCTFSNIQIEEGSEATAYVQYVEDGTKVTVKSCGKNIFDSRAKKYNGISVVEEQNRNKIVVSQPNAETYKSANFALPSALVGKKISISADAQTSGGNMALLRVMWIDNANGAAGGHVISASYSGQTAKKLTAIGVVPEQPDAAHNKLCLLLYSNASGQDLSSGQTYTATYSNIQIEIGGIATDFEPYTEYKSIIVETPEKIEFTSVAPSIAITTDNKGIIIDAVYNKDFNRVVEKLTQAIISLGGVV